MRLFVAIDLEEIGEYASRLKAEIKEDGIVPAAGTHLTLKFLGEVSEERANAVRERLREINFSPFEISTAGIGFFPDEKRIRVVWLGIKENKEVGRLQESVEEKLAEFGFRKDHAFHPHITLARVKFVRDREGFLKRIMSLKTEERTARVKSFALFRSTLTPRGPVYDVVEEYGGQGSGPAS